MSRTCTLYVTITIRTFDDTESFLHTNYVAHNYWERISSGRLPSSSLGNFTRYYTSLDNIFKVSWLSDDSASGSFYNAVIIVRHTSQLRWLHDWNGRYGWCIDARLMFTCMMWHRHRYNLPLIFGMFSISSMVDITTASGNIVRNAFEERNIACQWPISPSRGNHWPLDMHYFVWLCRVARLNGTFPTVGNQHLVTDIEILSMITESAVCVLPHFLFHEIVSLSHGLIGYGHAQFW